MKKSLDSWTCLLGNIYQATLWVRRSGLWEKVWSHFKDGDCGKLQYCRKFTQTQISPCGEMRKHYAWGESSSWRTWRVSPVLMDEHGVPAHHPLLREQHSLGAQFPVTFVLPVWSALFWDASYSSQKTSAWVRVMSKWTGMNYCFQMKIKSAKHSITPYPFCSPRVQDF